MRDDFITLSCPSCHGKLEITDDIDRFACGYCGVEHIVKRKGGIVALKLVEENIEAIKGGVDKTASELAISRLASEIEAIKKKSQEITKYRTELWTEYYVELRNKNNRRCILASLVMFGITLLLMPIIGAFAFLFLIVAQFLLVIVYMRIIGDRYLTPLA